MTRKLIGSLPKDKSYRIISVKSLGLESCASCDNCNKAIANIVEIQDNDNKTYYVGLDCANTLNNLDKTKLDYYTDCVKEARSVRQNILRFLKSKSHVHTKVSFFSLQTKNNFWQEKGAGGYFIHVNYKVNPNPDNLSEYGTAEKYCSFNKNMWENFIFPTIKDIGV